MELGIASGNLWSYSCEYHGGPIAKFLIKRYDLKPQEQQSLDVGVSENQPEPKITSYDFLDAMLAHSYLYHCWCFLK